MAPAFLRTRPHCIVNHEGRMLIRIEDGVEQTWWSWTLEQYEGDRPLFRPLSVRHVSRRFGSSFLALENVATYYDNCIP